MIPFNKPLITGRESNYLQEAIEGGSFSGDGVFGRKCESWIQNNFECEKALLTPSCTAALELSAMLIDIQPGDEVIMPSYTFVSTANAFVLRGAKIIFVDITPSTMNLNPSLIEQAITTQTKAIVPVHYAGVSCDMEVIMGLADKYGLWVIEDAAQGVMSTYKGKPLGTIGHLGCFSFHDTKNYTAGGEGGAICVNAPSLIDRAEVIRQKGTNRANFINGIVDKYTWIDLGSSFLPSEMQAAFLYAQLEVAKEVNIKRRQLWETYYKGLLPLGIEGLIELPLVPENCEHNAHMFFLKCKDEAQRKLLMNFLSERGVSSAFHYIPLHSSDAGLSFSDFFGGDNFTTSESQRILRLPMYFSLLISEVHEVVRAVKSFYA